MKLWENRRIAAVVLAVCVLGSVVGLGGGSLARARADALRVFEEGSDPSLSVRFSMDAYLEDCAEYARVLAEEFRLHAGGEGESAARALELAGAVASDGVSARGTTPMSSSAAQWDALYTDFYAQAPSEEEARAFQAAYLDFQSEVDMLEYDDYHAMGARLQPLALRVFQRSVVAKLLGLGALDPF